MLQEDLLLGSLVGKCMTAHKDLSGSLRLDGQLAAAFVSSLLKVSFANVGDTLAGF